MSLILIEFFIRLGYELGKELGEEEASGAAGAVGLTLLAAVIGKNNVAGLGGVGEGVGKLLKAARVAPVLESVQVTLGSACTWATTSVRNMGYTSL